MNLQIRHQELPANPGHELQTAAIQPWVKAAREFCGFLLALPPAGDSRTINSHSQKAKVENDGAGSCKVIDFIGWKKVDSERIVDIIKKPKGTEFVKEKETAYICYLAEDVRMAVRKIAEKNGVEYEFYVEDKDSYSRGPSIPPGCDFTANKVSLIFAEK